MDLLKEIKSELDCVINKPYGWTCCKYDFEDLDEKKFDEIKNILEDIHFLVETEITKQEKQFLMT
jgi:hypothetical protein